VPLIRATYNNHVECGTNNLDKYLKPKSGTCYKHSIGMGGIHLRLGAWKGIKLSQRLLPPEYHLTNQKSFDYGVV
jgi:hypothetical protein